MVTVVNNAANQDLKNEQTQAVLKKLRETSIEEVASQLAQKAGFPYIDLHIFPIGSEDVLLIPEADALRLNLILFHKKGVQVRFAIIDPENQETLDYIETISTPKGWET